MAPSGWRSVDLAAGGTCGCGILARAAAASPAAPAAATGDHDAIAVTKLSGAGRDDFRALGETSEDLHQLCPARSDLHRAEYGGLAERLEHAAPAAKIDERVSRHDERILGRVERDADARISRA